MPLIAIAKELAISAFLGILLGSGTAWTIQGWRIAAIKADAIEAKAKAIQQEKDRADKIGNDYAEVVRFLNEQKQARTVTVVKELEKPIYRDVACVLPESGRLLVNAAVREANAARLGHTVLPEPAAPGGTANDGRSPSMVDVGARGLRRLFGGEIRVDQMGD